MSSPLTVQTLAALRGERGTSLLDAVAARGVSDAEVLSTSAAMRAAGHPVELVSAAIETVRLRGRATAKFGPSATRMFFTSSGLEQSTRQRVADHRAQRFTAAGATAVTDLCCGIGGDLLALARAGIGVHAVDSDPLTVAVAAANSEVLELAARVELSCSDVTEFDLAGVRAVFCDPARRSGRRRIFDPASYSPSWDFLLSLAAKVPFTGVKVAPGIDHALLPSGVEAEWISDEGEVKEAALWFGPLGLVRHRATLLPSGDTLVGSGAELAPTGPVGNWLYDPDGAVVRAHLIAELAELIGAHGVDPTIAYLTSDELRPTPFARAYRVEEVLPFSLKRLRTALRARRVGRVEIKKRGSALDVEQLRRDLRLSGDQEATVVLTRVAGKPTVLICSAHR